MQSALRQRSGQLLVMLSCLDIHSIPQRQRPRINLRAQRRRCKLIRFSIQTFITNHGISALLQNLSTQRPSPNSPSASHSTLSLTTSPSAAPYAYSIRVPFRYSHRTRPTLPPPFPCSPQGADMPPCPRTLWTFRMRGWKAGIPAIKVHVSRS